MEVTITLDDDLARKVEQVAAVRGTSVAALIHDGVAGMIEDEARDRAYHDAIRRSLALPKARFSGPLPSRQERNERAGLSGL